MSKKHKVQLNKPGISAVFAEKIKPGISVIFAEKSKSLSDILKFPEIYHRKLLNFSENDFRKVIMNFKVRKIKLIFNQFSLGVRKNIYDYQNC